MEEGTERAEEQARAQLDAIIEMVKALDTTDEDALEQAQAAISEGPLNVEVRTNWYSPGKEAEVVEYRILLCWGGPAVRIIGSLDAYSQPESAGLEYQDWYTPWIPYQVSDEERKAVLVYARQFYYGN